MVFAFLHVRSNINDWVLELFKNLVTAQKSVY